MGDSYLDLLMAQEQAVPAAGASVEGGGGVWVVAHAAGNVASVTLEALGAARGLADALGAYVHAVLLGEGVAGSASLLYQAGADTVRVADHPALASFALRPCLEVLAALVEGGQPEVVILPATVEGGQLAARLAQRTGGGLIERARAITLDEAARVVQAAVPIYGGEYFEIVACPAARPQFLTIHPGAFPAPFLDPGRGGEPVLLEVEPVEPDVRTLGEAEGFVPPVVPLAQAPVIVAAGRQVGDLAAVRQLAEALGGQLAGDRGARDAGWIEAGQVVDVRGATVAPEVYLAVGVRGDTFHNAAVEGAGFVAAIHPEGDAPVFRVADLCLVADPRQVLPPLVEALRNGAALPRE